MALPTTRKEFKDYCLRRLGHPVVSINVSEEQIDDRVDDALQYYYDYHFDGTEKLYYKHIVTANNRGDAIYNCVITNSGISYSNNDTVVFTSVSGNGAHATITTSNTGSIVSFNLLDNGQHYSIAPTITITSNTGNGAIINAYLGGKIIIPENIIGVVKVFDIGTSFATNNMFNVRYQIALNELWSLSNIEMAPYYMAMQHLRLIEEILVGKKPIRYNRHRNELFIDMDWSYVKNDDYIIIECYSIVDPEEFPNVWKDRWLLQYATQLIKRQWGEQLKKYTGVVLLGGVQFNGQQIYDEAEQKIAQLESEMINSYSLPATHFIG